MPIIRERRFLRVKLDMVTKCQLRCVMCHFAHPQFEQSPIVMGGELLEKVCNDLFPRAHDVVLSSAAEPLLAPDLPRALELCREHGVPNFHFSTNLLSMTRKIMEKVIEVQMPLLTISCDGATKETFERIRPPAKWENFLAKWDLVHEVKSASGSAFPKLSVTAVLMRSNIHEMPALVHLAHERGVTQMNFVHMGVIGGLGVEHETLINDPKLCNRTMRAIRAACDEVGMQAVIPMEIPEHFHADDGPDTTDSTRSDAGGGVALLGAADAAVTADEYMNSKIDEFLLKARKRAGHTRACYFPWYYVHVNPDGTVFPCGSWFEFTSFGDFKTQTFEEIWTGPQFRELRDQIYRMELRDVCANCSVANMGRPDVKASFSHRAKVRRQDGRAVVPGTDA